MQLTINNRDWNVLSKLLINSGINTFTVSQIINSHKKILNDFKEKLEYKKAVELAKFRKQLEKKQVKNKENKILKFTTQKDEELTNKFREKFYVIAQQVEGKFT
jgi:hypothetical protein